MATDKADLLPQRKDAVRRAAPRSWVSRAGLFLLRSREASIAVAGIRADYLLSKYSASIPVA